MKFKKMGFGACPKIKKNKKFKLENVTFSSLAFFYFSVSGYPLAMLARVRSFALGCSIFGTFVPQGNALPLIFRLSRKV